LQKDIHNKWYQRKDKKKLEKISRKSSSYRWKSKSDPSGREVGGEQCLVYWEQSGGHWHKEEAREKHHLCGTS
jgi:hypothetical protein